MATEARYGWELPDLGDVADGPDAFAQFASDISDTLADKTITSYTPSWTAVAGGTAPTSPSSRVGWYRVQNGFCDFVAQLFFGPSTSGGRGALLIGLPVAARSTVTEQTVLASTWQPLSSSKWQGIGVIQGASPSVVQAWFPYPAAPYYSSLAPWQSTDGSGATGTGIPRVTGQYGVQNGGNCWVGGRYIVA